MTGTFAYPRNAFLGFDHIFDQLESIHKHAKDTYPPHNVVKEEDLKYSLELAVAGFSEDELEVDVKERTLTVKGDHITKGREFIHRGISTKKFRRTFRLSEYVEVHGADLVDGVLAIDLKIVVPEEMRPRKIKIGKNEESKHDTRQQLNEKRR